MSVLKLRASMGCESGARASRFRGSRARAVEGAVSAAVFTAASNAAASIHFTFYQSTDVDAAAARLYRVLLPNDMFQCQVCKRHHLATDAKYYLSTDNFCCLHIQAKEGTSGRRLRRTGGKKDRNNYGLRCLSCEVVGRGLVV